MDITLNVNIVVDSIEDGKMIAHDLHELLNSSNITNSVELDESSKND